MAIDYVSTSYPKDGTFADNTLYVNPSAKEVRVGETIIGKNYNDEYNKLEGLINSEKDIRENDILNIKKNAAHNNQYYIRYVPIVGASKRVAASTNGCSIDRAYFNKDGAQITSTNTGNKTPSSTNCPIGAYRGLIFGNDYTYAEVLIPLDGSHSTHMSSVKDNINDVAIGILGVHMYNVSFGGILSSFSIKRTKDPEATTDTSSYDFVRLLFIFPSKETRNITDKGVKKEIAGEAGADYIKLSKNIASDKIGYKQFKNSFSGSYVKVLFKRSESDWEKLNG